jgi:hypothetical protein
MRGVRHGELSEGSAAYLRIGEPWPADAASRRSDDYTTGLMIMNMSSECLVDA